MGRQQSALQTCHVQMAHRVFHEPGKSRSISVNLVQVLKLATI